MTFRSIFEMAALRIMSNQEYIAWIRKRDKERSLSEDDLRLQLSDLVISMVTKENEFILKIIKEIPEPRLKKIVKDAIREYDTVVDSEKATKRTRKKPNNKTVAGVP